MEVEGRQAHLREYAEEKFRAVSGGRQIALYGTFVPYGLKACSLGKCPVVLQAICYLKLHVMRCLQIACRPVRHFQELSAVSGENFEAFHLLATPLLTSDVCTQSAGSALENLIGAARGGPSLVLLSAVAATKMDSLVEPEQDFSLPPWGTLGRDATIGLVALGSNVILHFFNRLSIDGRERFVRLVTQRHHGTALFTVCNHTRSELELEEMCCTWVKRGRVRFVCCSTLDDPMLLAAMLPLPFFWNESRHHGTRWSLCAREICYRNALFRHVFQNGKTLPIDRGGGVHQPIMQVVAEKAARGEWVHVFPEARISYTGHLQPLKRGIGKLVCDSLRPGNADPIVLPFYHSGMGRVLPKGGRLPRAGNAVHVSVGHPVDLSDLLLRCNRKEHEQPQVWSDIAQRVSQALAALERTSPPNWNQTAHSS